MKLNLSTPPSDPWIILLIGIILILFMDGCIESSVQNFGNVSCEWIEEEYNKCGIFDICPFDKMDIRECYFVNKDNYYNWEQKVNED